MAPIKVNKPQVLIVGGGPVGVFTALILARNGIKVMLVEERDEADTAPRAMAFQPCALAEMVEAGVYEDVYRDSVKEAVISWWKSGSGYEKQHLATISTNEGDQPFLTGLNYSQSDFTKIILQHLQKEENAKIFFGHKITSIMTSADSVRVTAAQLGHFIWNLTTRRSSRRHGLLALTVDEAQCVLNPALLSKASRGKISDSWRRMSDTPSKSMDSPPQT